MQRNWHALFILKHSQANLEFTYQKQRSFEFENSEYARNIAHSSSADCGIETVILAGIGRCGVYYIIGRRCAPLTLNLGKHRLGCMGRE